jgi:PIN domain nuclease of toxin-antitoxin system
LIKVVLDASALLALLNDEPGAEVVEQEIPGAAMDAVNLSEVIAKLAERGMPEEAIRQALDAIELEIHPFDAVSAYQTGILRVQTRSLGLSLGDRACVARGKHLGAAVLTTDGDWQGLEIGVDVRVIR